MSRRIYLVGSLRNPVVPEIAARLRKLGHYVFDDWYAAGPEADDKWKEYETARGREYPEALHGHAATHVYEYDKHHLDDANTGVLVLPAGRSGHLELGYLVGQGKEAFILVDDGSTRWDVMYRFASGVFFAFDMLADRLAKPFFMPCSTDAQAIARPLDPGEMRTH